MSRNKNEHRPHYLPHQHIKDKQRMIEHNIKKYKDINGILTMISGNENGSKKKREKSCDDLKNHLSVDAEYKLNNTKNIKIIETETVGNSKSNHTNLLLFGQYSTTTTTMTSKSQKSAEKKCIGCTPGGLATTALNMNLSTISPLCTNVGCIGTSCSKEANSGSHLSRSASPALGNTSDNPRFKKLVPKHKHLLIYFTFFF